MASTTLAGPSERPEAFAQLLLDSSAGVFRVFGIYLGLRLGYYDALREGPLTAPDLARRTGTHVRYAREWLEQQSVSGVLAVADATLGPDARVFSLPKGHAEVLTDADSLNYLAPLVQMLIGCTRPIDDVVEAYATGGGVPFSAYGADMRDGQAAMNRPMFLSLIGTAWVPTMKDIYARLQQPGARVADVGCGAAWSSIALARAYPEAQVDGFDLDEASVQLGQRNVLEMGLAERVSVELRDAADPKLRGTYDLVTAFECIHDMSKPVEALHAMRGLLNEGGAVLVVDERVGERFTPKGVGLEWMMYGWSVVHCLPVGMAEQPSAATGTVLRPDLMRTYAREAGFSRCEELPVANDLFRLYRLDP